MPEPPIIITDYDPSWPTRYELEKSLILGAVGPYAAAVEHIGSTSVPGLAAKPIIDILVGLNDLADAQWCIEPMERTGYEYVPEYEVQLPDRRYFRRPPGEEVVRKYHVHMVEVGGAFWTRHVLFRDYLRAHPEAAAEYADLKRRLAAEYGSDMAGYTDAKTDFIRAVERRARG
jgi:GrpB-like predicted nucleotidyltransferase (UPF0157 family)